MCPCTVCFGLGVSNSGSFGNPLAAGGGGEKANWRDVCGDPQECLRARASLHGQLSSGDGRAKSRPTSAAIATEGLCRCSRIWVGDDAAVGLACRRRRGVMESPLMRAGTGTPTVVEYADGENDARLQEKLRRSGDGVRQRRSVQLRFQLATLGLRRRSTNAKRI
jgi:hypothetical protein